jgi:hypothetical protein
MEIQIFYEVKEYDNELKRGEERLIREGNRKSSLPCSR